MQVAIPTKGRPATTTYKLLGDIPFTHFVEPQDMAAYKAAKVPNLQEIPDNDKGITFVRNYILDWGHVCGHKWLWIMDDDINGFGVAKAGKTIKGNHNVLKQFHKAVEQFKFPVNGLNYCQYAWSYSTKKQRFAINKRPPEVCALLYLPKITWRYRADRKEDRDFTMLAIQHSDGVIVDLHAWFNCPGVGTNAGGLQHLYQQKRDAVWAQRLVNDWAPFAKLIKKKDRVDAKLDISGYAKHMKRVVR